MNFVNMSQNSKKIGLKKLSTKHTSKLTKETKARNEKLTQHFDSFISLRWDFFDNIFVKNLLKIPYLKFAFDEKLIISRYQLWGSLVNLPSSGPHTNFQIFFPKFSKYCPESESDKLSGFCRKCRKTPGKLEKPQNTYFL